MSFEKKLIRFWASVAKFWDNIWLIDDNLDKLFAEYGYYRPKIMEDHLDNIFSEIITMKLNEFNRTFDREYIVRPSDHLSHNRFILRCDIQLSKDFAMSEMIHRTQKSVEEGE